VAVLLAAVIVYARADASAGAIKSGGKNSPGGKKWLF